MALAQTASSFNPFNLDSSIILGAACCARPSPSPRRSSRRRRVTFVEQANVFPTTSATSLVTLQEYNDIWMTAQHIQDNKALVRALGRQLQCYEQHPSINIRGVEYYAQVNRKKLKRLTIRTIVKAQADCDSPEHLATVAQKYTASARAEAQIMGMEDYANVYGFSYAGC